MEKVVESYKKWLNKYEEDDVWLRDNILDRDLSQLNRFQQALNRKAAIGVYGESQAGKSFLISALLKGKEKELSINIGNDSISFTDLNPDQNTEATAVICRYTQQDTSNIPDGYIKGELHTIGELIRVLFGGMNELDLTEISESLSNFQLDEENIPHGKITLSSAKIYDLLDHINGLKLEMENRNQREFSRVLEQIYFIIENQYIDSLSLKALEYLLNPLWGDFTTYKEIVSEIFDFYSKVNTEDEQIFYLNSELVRDVLNTNTLYHAQENDDTFSVSGNRNKRIEDGNEFLLSTLQIACSEIVLPCESKSEILENVDFLDFPGLRPFAEKGNLKSPKQLDGKYSKVMEIIKQGKLKITFDLYSKKREIPAVLLVTSGDNQNARSLPKIIRGWISENYTDGEKNINEEDVNSLLFTVMTKADGLLKKGSFSVDTIKNRINSRFDVTYQKFFSEFLQEVPNYNNVYMTINTEIETVSLLKGDKKKETRKIFINHPLVRKNLGERAEEVFDTLYDDTKGISLLKRSLLEITDRLQRIKSEYVKSSILSIIERIENHAKSYLVEKDREAQLNKEQERADYFSSEIKNNPAIYSVLAHYINSRFPKSLRISKQTNEKDPLGLGSIFEENTEDEEFNRLFTDVLDKYLENMTDEKTLKNYRFYNDYLRKIDQSHLTTFFSKAVKYLRSEDTLKEELSYILKGVDLNNKYQRRSFRNCIKYRCVSEINGYTKLFDKNLKGQKGVMKNLPDHLRDIYTCSLPNFDREANNDLKDILNEIKELKAI